MATAKGFSVVSTAFQPASMSSALVQEYSDKMLVVAVLNRRSTVHSWSLQRVTHHHSFEYLQNRKFQVRAAQTPGILDSQADIL
jgi:hypothetical protein